MVLKKKRFVVSVTIGGKRVIVGRRASFPSRKSARKELSFQIKRGRKKGIRLGNPRLIEVLN